MSRPFRSPPAPSRVNPAAPGAADEVELVQRLRTRHESALRDVYQRFSDRIFGYLYRLTTNRQVADDLHQETWLAVARHASALRADSDLAAWLFTIARNQYRSWCRARARGEGVTLMLDIQTHVSPAAAAPGRESLMDLEVALAALPAAAREILLLMGCEGLDTAQTSTVLDISPEAVRQRLSRARAALLLVLSADEVSAARQRVK